MDRARRWTVVLLIILTGVVVGFARFDSEHTESTVPTQFTPPAEPPDEEADLARADGYLRGFVDLLHEIGACGGPVPALPPLEQFPPLPADLLPPSG